MRRWLLVGLLLAVIAFPVAAAGDGPRLLMDGYRLPVPADQRPFIESGHILVPLRVIAEALGASVAWDAAGQTVTLSRADLSVQLQIGAATALVGSRRVPLAPPAELVNNHTYVPLRFISEGLGYSVDWDGPTATAAIDSPLPPTVSPVRCLNCLDDWGGPDDYPVFWTGSFWAPDRPESVPRLAFGVLGDDFSLSIPLKVGSYALSTALPSAPAELPVYKVGSYAASHRARFQMMMGNPSSWEYDPPYSEFHYVGGNPIGARAEVTTPEQAVQQAKKLLSGLLLPDSQQAHVAVTADGWRVIFFRWVNGLSVYPDHPIIVDLNRAGQATDMQGRRRPLLSASLYPLRTPEAAWRQLSEGHWVLPYITDGSPDFPATLERFTVTSVELAYAEPQSGRPTQFMQPLYLFRNAQGQALAVPAVADPYVRWPAQGGK